MKHFKYPPGAIVALRTSSVKDGYQPFMVSGYIQTEEGDFYQLRELCWDGSTFIIQMAVRETELHEEVTP